MQLYTILSPCKSIPYYPHANLYPIIPMQIYTLLSPWHDNPPFPSAPYIYYYCAFREKHHGFHGFDKVFSSALIEFLSFACIC